MSHDYERHESLRKHFGVQMGKTKIPSLLEFYKHSYEDFFQMDQSPLQRQKKGLEAILRSIFPIEAKQTGKGEHQRILYLYSHYLLEKPELSLEECRARSLSYLGTLHIVLFRIPLEKKQDDLKSSLRHPHLLEKFLFVLPLKGIPFLTSQNAFFLNGIERALLSQLQRCPGVFLSRKPDLTSLKIIPYYGVNLQFEIGKSNQVFVRILGKRRISLPLFLLALGFPREELLAFFFNPFRLRQDLGFQTLLPKTENHSLRPVYDLRHFLYGITTSPIRDLKQKCIRIPAGTIITPQVYLQILSSTLLNFPLSKEQWSCFSFLDSSLIHTKEYLPTSPVTSSGHFVTLASSSPFYPHEYYVSSGSPQLSEKVFSHPEKMPLWKRLFLDSVKQHDGKEKLVAFSQMIQMMNGKRNGHVCGEFEREELMKKLFLDPIHYNLSHLGRDQMSHFLVTPLLQFGVLTKLDFLTIVSHLFSTRYFPSTQVDSGENVYQLQNRKVRLPGDLFGYLLLKSFLQIKRRRDFAEKFEYPIEYWNPKKNLPLPHFLRSKIHSFFLLPSSFELKHPIWKLTEKTSSFLSHRWLQSRSLVYSDPSEKLNIQFLPFAKRQIDHFLTGSNLSQLLDQLNPLSEMTHLRRLSLLGPDGLNKENVSLDTRDVQSSFFGRICPIETPEGKAVGIVNSMSTFAQIDFSGDLLAPYQKVENGEIIAEVHYLSSKKERLFSLAQWEESRTQENQFREPWIYCRFENQFIYQDADKVDYLDASSKQMLSFTSSLIPFVEHNDGNRALMGSNMQRQAVPPLLKEIPLVGTGSEDCLGNQESRSSLSQLLWFDQNVFFTFHPDNKRFQSHELLQYEKANQKSYLHESIRQNPPLSYYEKGRLFERNGTSSGEISIGHNLLIGFMSMNGYSFEDSIVISDRLLKGSYYSSLHTKEMIVFDWNQNSSQEKMTRQIPGIPTQELSYLDESGVIRVGTRFQGGEILVGKVLQQSKLRKPMSEKEVFLHSLLLHSTKETWKDTSERLPNDLEGCVLDVKKFFAPQIPVVNGSLRSWKRKIHQLTQSYLLHVVLLQQFFLSKSMPIEFWTAKRSRKEWKEIRSRLSLRRMPMKATREWMIWLLCNKQLRLTWYRKYLYRMAVLRFLQSKASSSLLKMVKIVIGYRHRLKPGDKMTGRHGNKGVVCQVLPMSEMPYLSDGTSFDILLNPIGISSRMNLGQVFEVHLGWTGVHLGRQLKQMLRRQNQDSQYLEIRSWLLHLYGSRSREGLLISKMSRDQLKHLLSRLVKGIPMATLPFEGASSLDLRDGLEFANLPGHGQSEVHDGKTGEKFDRLITGGQMYILKLNHLVDEKIHSRFTGPYNRVTEQPLGGKSLDGGQRFGEMEVWALQAYGAAYTLFDMITVKSDSRWSGNKKSKKKKIYPEAFQVLLRELWSLGIMLKVS
uniref:DNA-directed RNA polymerase subunit beta n=1 Tax=Andalucia godoyi TaxID=505711 RepID=M4QBK7_ANDGO|nr:RNA polymerase subunit beta [Andalucia godoyi]AGH23969.1 RNA polymerase subunit beta [Andalucia godoyi]